MPILSILVDLAIPAHHALLTRLPFRALRTFLPPPSAGGTPRFAIIPGDVGDPAGSLGDVAMFSGLMHGLRQRHPGATFTIIGQGNHRITVPGIGEVPVIAAWHGIAGALAFDRAIRTHHGLFVMGADILDGKYGAALVARIAAYCNHGVGLGIPVTIMGFSFNRHPRHACVRALSRLHPDVIANVRDAISLERFNRLTGVAGRLCADSAFLMPATADMRDKEIGAWISEQRAANRIPIGINLNAHALSPVLGHANQLQQVLSSIAERLDHIARRHALSLLLIPHDFKPESGDIVMLKMLEKQLHAYGCKYVRYVEIDSPDRVKHVVKQLDLVFAGRMHLAIAALGSGTPVLCITYQDKFEGLYRHFTLPLAHTMQAEDCLNDSLDAKFNAVLTSRNEVRALIASRLPAVLQLTAPNLELRSRIHGVDRHTTRPDQSSRP